MARTKTVTLGQLEARRTRVQEQIRKAKEREVALELRLRKLESQYYGVRLTLGSKNNVLAGLNGIISLMAGAGAVGYVSQGGAIRKWVMPDGSRTDATEED